MADRTRGSSGWVAGVAMVLIGIGWITRDRGPSPSFDRTKWWAWLLLLPAVMLLVSAARRWRAERKVGGTLMSALAIIWIAAVFLLGLPWGGSWPLLLILMGGYQIARSAGR